MCVQGQTQLISSLRAKFSDTREEVKGLTSRTKNLFAPQANLHGDAVNDAVVKTWVDDLVKASEGGGVEGWRFVGEKEGVTIDSKAFGDQNQVRKHHEPNPSPS